MFRGLDPHRVDPSKCLVTPGFGLDPRRSDPSECRRIVFYS